MDFQAAGDMDSGNIYKVCNAVSRKLLAYVSLARFLQAFMFSGDVSSWSCLKLNTSGFNFAQAAESRLYFIASRKYVAKLKMNSRSLELYQTNWMHAYANPTCYELVS